LNEAQRSNFTFLLQLQLNSNSSGLVEWTKTDGLHYKHNIFLSLGDRFAKMCMKALLFLVATCIVNNNVLQASAMTMGNMLMGQTLEQFLSDLVSFRDISKRQKKDILNMSDRYNANYDPVSDNLDHRDDVFSTEESKQALRNYIFGEINADKMDIEAGETIASMLSLGGLYPEEESANSASLVEGNLVAGPVGSDYTGNGNVVRLGRSNTFTGSGAAFGYSGIWGYAVGEFSLQMCMFLQLIMHTSCTVCIVIMTFSFD
jgi:hypothetical protein